MKRNDTILIFRKKNYELICFFLDLGSIFYRYDLNFDQAILGKRLDCDCRACGEIAAELAGVNLVHRREISHVGQEYGCLYHVVDAHARLVEDGFDVVERLGCLLLDAALGEIACRRVKSKLSGSEEHVIY